MTVTSAGARRYAHELAQRPSSAGYATAEMPGLLARHHIARAAGFYLGAQETGWAWSEGTTCLIYEYQLALVWFRLARDGQSQAVDLSRHLLAETTDPRMMGSTLLTMLNWAGLDTGLIRPYLPEPPRQSRGRHL